MRKIVVPSLTVLVVLALVHAQVFAAAAGSVTSPLGFVLQAHQADVSASSAIAGSTVFDGDALSTSAQGILQVRFGGSQAYLLPRTSAVVHQLTGGFGASMSSGSVILSSASGETFHLVADGATIQPANASPTVGQVTIVSPTEMTLVSRKGILQISMGDDVKTVAEGSSFRMVIQPEAAAGTPDPQAAYGSAWSATTTYAQGDVVTYNGVLYTSAVNNNLDHMPGSKTYWGRRRAAGGNNGSGASATGRNRFLLIALGLVGVGVGVGLWVALESPSAP